MIKAVFRRIMSLIFGRITGEVQTGNPSIADPIVRDKHHRQL
jgi:hypothetical protein